jgi:mono/diheme cytochrome c family protein
MDDPRKTHYFLKRRKSAYNSSQNFTRHIDARLLTSAEEAFMSKSFLLLFAAALLVVVSLPLQGRRPQATPPAPAPALAPQSAVAPTPAAPVKNPVKPTAESQAKAKSVYERDCALCHGENGNGKTDLATGMGLTMDDWTDPKTLANKEDWELFNVIRSGKDKMPPEEVGRASDTEVWNLIIYIRTFSKPQASAPASPTQ